MKGVGDWDDLRYVKFAADHGSFTRAAPALGVDVATVLRRVNVLEARLGARLFSRSRAGLSLTEIGERVLASANLVLGEIRSMELDVIGRDVALEGEIVLSTTDDLALAFAEPAIHAFRRQYPGVVVDLRHDSRIVNLNEREADVVLRCSRRPPPLLVGRRLGEVELGVYRATGKTAGQTAGKTGSRGARADAADLPWLLWSNDRAPPEVQHYLEKHAGDGPVAMRTDSFLTQQRACATGLGIAVLPCVLADRDPALTRTPMADDPEPSLLWLLTHRRSRDIPRIRAFMSLVGQAILEDSGIRAEP